MGNRIKEVNDQRNEQGASMLEYALLAALIAIVCIAAVLFLGEQASTTFSRVGVHLETTN